ncbi:type II secretion system protein [Lyngbya sp. CCY1209]|uniref:pilus assembly FimT family protein n=1 Tax=Lyngbya sp. CCY1209 TaxID=2886103 RepID=UPI002D1FC9FC|nr:type II secretion system protein [Lyngbya sp. CCY1209]MEB3887223.1 type II secretion system GspH family protein [Lyngbya sp. CCY1209]
MPHRDKSEAGFSLLELLFVTVIIGVLSAIAVPGWLGFARRQELRRAQSQAYWVMKAARRNARRDKRAWQATFRKQGDRIQWALHKPETSPANLPNSAWTDFDGGIDIDANETSLRKVWPETNRVTTSDTNHYRTLFNYKGCPVHSPQDNCGATNFRAKGRITFKHGDMGEVRRCVIVSTLLGVVRKGEDASEATADGKNCYRD